MVLEDDGRAAERRGRVGVPGTRLLGHREDGATDREVGVRDGRPAPVEEAYDLARPERLDVEVDRAGGIADDKERYEL
jgi:hypothetical protein